MNRLTLILAAIVAIGVAYGAGQWHGDSRGYNRSQTEHRIALAEVERENAKRQKALIRGVERVAQDAEEERAQIENRLAAANDAVGRLRAEIRDADSNGDSTATAVADASRARSLLAECAERYRDMAATADQLRAVVLGLQDYAKTITQTQ